MRAHHQSSTRLILLNKPYGVLTQFSGPPKQPCLRDYVPIPGVYPAGRLDKNSEGLLLLTNDGQLQHRLTHPRQKQAKTYLVLVERQPDEVALERLRTGVELADGRTAPAQVRQVTEPTWLWPRQPPVRYRKNVVDVWLELTLTEGRNRQVRRMTAAVGHPTLRLIRTQIGPFQLGPLQPGEWREESLDKKQLGQLLSGARK